MNMAATLFRMTVDECLIGVTRAAAQALGLARRVGTLEAGKQCDLAIWNVERPAELVYAHRAQPAARARVERRMSGAHHEWLALHHGDAPLVVSFPHTGTEIPAGHRSESRLALARAQGRRLLGRRALRLRARDGRHHDAYGAVAHRHRRESRSFGRVAVPGAGHHRPLPHRNLRRRAIVLTGQRARRRRDRAPARGVLRSLSRGARLRAATPARAPSRAWCCSTRTRSARACRGCSKERCRSSTSARTTAPPAMPR